MAEWFADRVLVAGRGSGPALVLHEPLSFWGGIDPHTGRIVGRHARVGESVSGTVLVLPSGRGSSSSSSVLAELIRAGLGPAAILLQEIDEIVALGALVAGELYGSSCPVIVWAAPPPDLADGHTLAIHEDGRIEMLRT